MLIKKRPLYLIVGLLLTPLVGHAVTLPPIEDDDLRSLITALPARCARLPSSLDDSARSEVATFYQPLAGQFAWPDEASRAALQTQINQLADDGLSPEDYPLPSLPVDASIQARGCVDVLTTHAYLHALKDLHYGRLSQDKLEGLWRSTGVAPRAPAGLAVMPVALMNLSEPERAFTAVRPSSTQYKNLRMAYAASRTQPLASWQMIADGQLLRPGGVDSRVPALRARLSAEGYDIVTPTTEVNRFDSATVLALQRFQARHGLNDDGVLGAASLNELNVPAVIRRDQLRANLERMRWRADDLDNAQVVINVAGAEVMLMQNGAEVWRKRTQVGREERKTPLLVSRINRITLNPTWTVPPTILREDKIPAIRNDIGYLAQHQMNVYDRQGNRLNPHEINWSAPGAIMLRQEAGVNNPLGRMVLRFDNPYSVYLHDTPSQRLFDRSPRVFSSGCVRVEAIETLLSKILTDEELTIVQARLASGKTSQYRLEQPLMLVIAYWTAEAGDDGVIRYYPDMYNNDQKIISAQLRNN